jgi:2-oxoglutarate/2-oxoacid ferredoxin oxidoreductase subunit alpha
MSAKIENTFTWKIAGEAGFGINTSGLLFSKIMTRSGFYCFEYSEYPSLIRGGHQTSQVTVDTSPVFGVRSSINLLVGLNRHALATHAGELSFGAGILYDSAHYTLTSAESQIGLRIKDTILFPVPFTDLAVKYAGLNIMRNMVAVGSSLYLLGFDLKVAESLIEEVYSDAKVENIAAVRAGYSYIAEHYEALSQTFGYKKASLAPLLQKPYVITGNEALGMGAVAGGVTFYAGYPMTPSSTIMGFMAEHQYEYGYIVRHAEDEISVINMAIGASFAGARSLVATSGGGMALMAEGVGMAAITETPITIINSQRPGPATGLPTWTDQGDLRFILHSAQGEFLRIVIAPGDIEECYLAVKHALNLAEEFQLPVFVLSDKYLSESHGTVLQFSDAEAVSRGKLYIQKDEIPVMPESNFKRYEPTNDGVSPRTIPGVESGIFLANSDEHDDYGFTSEESDVRIEQVDKRQLKLHYIQKRFPSPALYGNVHSSVLLVGWGSVKGPVLEAMKLFEQEFDTNVAFMHLMYLWPFPKEEVAKTINSYRRVVLVENNSTAQLMGIIEQMTGIHIHEKWLKYDGRPFFAEELLEKLENVIKNRKF